MTINELYNNYYKDDSSLLKKVNVYLRSRMVTLITFDSCYIEHMSIHFSYSFSVILLLLFISPHPKVHYKMTNHHHHHDYDYYDYYSYYSY
jgi:hypothetical protein